MTNRRADHTSAPKHLAVHTQQEAERPAAAPEVTAVPARHARGGRRKAVKHRRSVPVSAAIGGSALMLAAVGAVALSQPVQSAGAQPSASGSRLDGAAAQPGNGEPHDSLYSRSVPGISRGGARAGAVSPSLESAAEAQALARKAQLATAAIQAKSYAKDLASQAWVLPTTGFHISTWFGEPGYHWSSGYHTGIDFATACGTPIVAVTAGTVEQSGWDGPYGYQVRETLPNGDQVWYNHMTLIKTSLGAHLDKGGLIGLVGETGNAYGCHLHFEYRLKSDLETAVDPAPFFAAHGITLR